MFIFSTKKIRAFEKGLLFRDRVFERVLEPGRYWFVDLLDRVRVDVVSVRAPWLVHPDLDMIVKAEALGDDAVVIDLKDYERALVWIDGRFDCVLDTGRYALWTGFRDVRVEIQDARSVLFEHKDLNVILKSQGVELVLNVFTVEEGHVGVYFRDGEYAKTLQPGQYASWKRVGKVKLYNIDVREKVLDVSGQ